MCGRYVSPDQAAIERGCLSPVVLDLSPQARAAWIRFHDEVERELGARGAFSREPRR